jgi:hypothetical protein
MGLAYGIQHSLRRTRSAAQTPLNPGRAIVKRTLSLLATLAAHATAAQAQSLPLVRYHDAAGRFTVGVPATWSPSYQAVVDQIRARMDARTGSRLPPMAGFESPAGPQGYPALLMLIGAMHDTTLTEQALARQIGGPQVAADLERAVGRVNEGARDSLHLGALTWDPREHVMWVDGGNQAADGPPVKVLLVFRPVEHWGVMMSVVLGEGATLDDLRAIMLPIVRSLVVDGRSAAR